MSFYSRYYYQTIDRKNLKLWKQALNDEDFNNLVNELQISKDYNLDPRDATIYYAEWWRRKYNGGKPSKEDVFNSIGGNLRFYLDAHMFFKLAKVGAEILGLKWIIKQNTLYFRTLLLQGGLPLKHISENQNNYRDFLLAVLEEQPDTIDDFIFQPHIVNRLPLSSRNEIIYENCLEIVKTILNGESEYDDLLNSNKAIKTISDELKDRATKILERKRRTQKPQNYWMYDTDTETISLRLIFAEKISPESLSQILGFEPQEKIYQFYIDNVLACEFIRMLSGYYKTYWIKNSDWQWNLEDQLPDCFVVANNKKYEVKDFIQKVPDLEKPTLWSMVSDDEWRLVKGTGVSGENGLLFVPPEWETTLEPQTITLFSTHEINAIYFEGQTTIIHKTTREQREYRTNVNPFDWTIISQKPTWMLRSNMPVVTRKPEILVYNEKNELIRDGFTIYAKYMHPNQQWRLLSEMSVFPIGCVDIKIEKDGVMAYGSCFNIGNLNLEFSNQSINHAEISTNNQYFQIYISENDLLNITQNNNRFELNLNSQNTLRIPLGIKTRIKYGTSKSLICELVSPFRGIAMLDKDGNVIDKGYKISFRNLYGLRILKPSQSSAFITVENALRNASKKDVVVDKEIKINPQPLISFKDELLRLFYLSDAMDYRNHLTIQLSVGRERKTYTMYGFTHTLNVDTQFEREVSLFDSDDYLELYAVPLNCEAEEISLIPLEHCENNYRIPECSFTGQFIIVSVKDENKQLMPRYVNTDESFNAIDKSERIRNYFEELSNSDFNKNSWRILLAYFSICKEHNLPYSTFDQLRAISLDSSLAAKVFFYLGVNQEDTDEYVQRVIPEMEKDLGFCFHWVKKEDWQKAFHDIIDYADGVENTPYIIELMSKYFNDVGLSELYNFILQDDGRMNHSPIYNSDILAMRSSLGERMLNELPTDNLHVNHYYGVPINDHQRVSLLIHSPIAVVESILGKQTDYPIWGGDKFRDRIRRNIQYAQYLNPEFYKKVILHVLSTSQS